MTRIRRCIFASRLQGPRLPRTRTRAPRRWANRRLLPSSAVGNVRSTSGGRRMSDSNLMKFIQALKSDPALKERVIEAQREAMTNIRREADAIAAVARDAGFDLSEWAKRPTDGKS